MVHWLSIPPRYLVYLATRVAYVHVVYSSQLHRGGRGRGGEGEGGRRGGGREEHMQLYKSE